MRANLCITIILSFAIYSERGSQAAVVYDSITDEYYNGTDSDNYLEVGQTISLAGSARELTKIELQLGGNEDSEFRIRFYQLDGPPVGAAPASPLTLIWESPTQTFEWMPPFYNRRVIELPIPTITVPDTFAWTVVHPIPSEAVGVYGGTPSAFVGQSHSEWHRQEFVGLPHWFSFDDRVMGVRITAIFEPLPVVLVLIAILMIASWSRPNRRNLQSVGCVLAQRNPSGVLRLDH